MRILISGQTYYPGNNGQAIFTIHLAEGLARAGNEVAVVVPADDFMYRQENINGVQIHRLHSVPMKWLHPEAFLNLFPGLKFRSILKEFKPDVIHVQDHYFLNWDGVRIARHMGIPVMGTNHFLPENLLPYISRLPFPREFKIYVHWQLMIWTYNLVDLITTPTETAARILKQQKLSAPIIPVSCGVDTSWFKPESNFDRESVLKKWGLDPAASIFLYVGRLDREKRIDLLLLGLAQLLKSTSHSQPHHNVQLAIAGTGSGRAGLTALVETLGLAKEVVFLGYVPASDLPDLYRAASVFCMPSPEELQSIASLEAMASGKPVIAADARALPELVTTETNGYLFKSGNVDSMAAAFQWMLNHRSLWNSMGRASRSRAVAHSLDNTIHRYEELYSRLHETAPRPYRSTRRIKAPVSLD
jgi:1,2-diacylglycerol 3-alpha-glucosyltransferase